MAGLSSRITPFETRSSQFLFLDDGAKRHPHKCIAPSLREKKERDHPNYRERDDGRQGSKGHRLTPKEAEMVSPSIRDVSEQSSCIARRIGFATRVLDHGIIDRTALAESVGSPLLSLPGRAAFLLDA